MSEKEAGDLAGKFKDFANEAEKSRLKRLGAIGTVGGLAAGAAGGYLVGKHQKKEAEFDPRALGALAGGVAGTLHGLKKDETGERHALKGLVSGAVGAGLGGLAGHAIGAVSPSLSAAHNAQAVRSSPWAAGVVPPVQQTGHLALAPGQTVGQMMAKQPKLAFTTSQYSTALNPTILSGASDLPPLKKPRLDQAIQKAAASAPTRGNFMMASDIPSFRAPQLEKGIQKNSGDSVPMSKENMDLMSFELLKISAVNTPAGQLAHTQRIGAPKASAPPGPSIAEIAKPKGAQFGIGIPGAFKTKI
jgi:hypothetical protein